MKVNHIHLCLLIFALNLLQFCQCCSGSSVFKREKLKNILLDCFGICGVMKLPNHITTYDDCLRTCHADTKCVFLNNYNGQCHICSQDKHYLEHNAELIPAVNYTQAHARNYIFKKQNHNISCIINDCYSQKMRDSSAESGVYKVSQPNGEIKQVYCDMENDGGGWTVIQRRVDATVSFDRVWVDFEDGFGDLDGGSFWLGNRYIAELTSQTTYELRVDIADNNFAHTAYAVYSSFSLDGSDSYKLQFGSYIEGDAGDGLSGSSQNLNNHKFTTKDVNNDPYSGNCATKYSGGWWYHSCHAANLNGRYGDNNFGQGISWTTATFNNHYNTLEYSQMKIRPRNP